ncbi:MAG: leucine-rich repeat protein [Eubacteriales bacterium]
MKKLLSVFLALVMAIAMIPAGILTASALQEGDYYYSINDSKAEILGYFGAGGDVTIPATLGGFPVNLIGLSAFANCFELTSVIIPNSVTTILQEAFVSCFRLTSVIIPSSVNVVDEMAFYFCTGLTSATILNNNATIGDSAFGACDNLTIYGYENSTAQIYATSNTIPFSLIPAGGNDPVEFTATNAIGQTGAQVTVDVNISALSDSAAGTIVLPFDNTKLRLVSAVAGAALEDAVVEAQGSFIFDIVSTDDQTTLAYINQDGLNLGGSVLRVTYEILASVDQTIPVVPTVTELCDSSMETKDLAYNVTNGEIVVDNTHPVVTGVDQYGIYNVSKNPAFTDLNDVTAALNGDAFTSGTDVIAQGIYTLIVTDAAGNTTTVQFIIDKTAPAVDGVDDDGLYKEDKNPTFTDTYLDTATLDSSTFVSGTTVSEGTHILVVTDLAGNVTTVHFRIDETKPLLSLLTPSKYSPTTTLTVSIEYPEDDGVHQYKIGSGEWTLYTGAVTVAYTVLPADRTVYARSTDLAGNTSDESDVDLPNIVRLGDVSLNDEVSVVDALMALHHASGRLRQTAGTNAFFAGDVNSSSTITTIDALKILQFSGGIQSF